jgi:hypothetical protein
MANTEYQTTSGYLKGVINKALDSVGFDSPKEIRFVQDLYKFDRKFATFQANTPSEILIVDEKLLNLVESAHPSSKHKFVSAVESAVQVAALYKHGVDEHKAELAKNAEDKVLEKWGYGNGIAFTIGVLGIVGNDEFAAQTGQAVSYIGPCAITISSMLSEGLRRVQEEVPLHDIYKDAVLDVVDKNGKGSNVGFETLNVIANAIDRKKSVIGNLTQAVNNAFEAMIDPEKYKPNFVQKSLNEAQQAGQAESVRGIL